MKHYTDSLIEELLQENENFDAVKKLDAEIDTVTKQIKDLDQAITDRDWEIARGNGWSELKAKADELWGEAERLQRSYGHWTYKLIDQGDHYDYDEDSFKFIVDDEEKYNQYKDKVEEMFAEYRKLRDQLDEISKNNNELKKGDETLTKLKADKAAAGASLKTATTNKRASVNAIIAENQKDIDHVLNDILPSLDGTCTYSIAANKARADKDESYLLLPVEFRIDWEADADDYFDYDEYAGWDLSKYDKLEEDMTKALAEELPDAAESADTTEIKENYFLVNGTNIIIETDEVDMRDVDGELDPNEGATVYGTGYIYLYIKID